MMNREIEFRGKRPDTGGWVYGYYCKHTKRQVCPMGDELKPEDIAHLIINDGFADWNMPRSLQGYDVDPETVGQYTGLKDKNGVKIFEGDKVSCIDKVDGLRFEGVVGFKNGSFIVENDWCSHYRWIDYEVEIVGNKWDDSSLLLGGKQDDS